jgi:hypothetical protein
MRMGRGGGLQVAGAPGGSPLRRNGSSRGRGSHADGGYHRRRSSCTGVTRARPSDLHVLASGSAPTRGGSSMAAGARGEKGAA